MSDAALPLPLPDQPGPPRSTPAPWQADVALVVAAFFWGTTFVIVQDSLDDATPEDFLAARFLLGAAVLALVARRRTGSAGELLHGIAAGSALLVGFLLQTVGLQYTTPSTSAFLTYLLVVFVPVVAFVALRHRPHPATIGGIGLALVGLVLLTDGEGGGFGKGEVLTLGCALAFAIHIVMLGEVAGRHDPVRFTAVQMATVGFGCLVLAVVTGPTHRPSLTAAAFGAAVFTGLFATALAFLAMVWAQQAVSPSRAALILLLEPVFAVLLAWASGDPLTAGRVLGGGLILVAVILSEVVPKLLTARSRSVRLGNDAVRDEPHARSTSE